MLNSMGCLSLTMQVMFWYGSMKGIITGKTSLMTENYVHIKISGPL